MFRAAFGMEEAMRWGRKDEMTAGKWMVVIAFAITLWGTFYGIHIHHFRELKAKQQERLLKL